MIKRKKYFYLSILESFTYSIFCSEFNSFHIDFNIKVLSLYSNPGYYYLTCAIFSNLKNLKAGLYLIFIPSLFIYSLTCSCSLNNFSNSN